MNPERTLTFNDDGTIDPEQLEGMPQDFIDRVKSPEFQAKTRIAIQRHKDIQRVLANARKIKELAHEEHEARRPSGVSGRQRKRLRRLARIAGRATMKSVKEN